MIHKLIINSRGKMFASNRKTYSIGNIYLKGHLIVEQAVYNKV